MNLRGGAGNCIEMDLVNEFQNNDFKENLKHSRGRFTDDQVTRCSRIAGPLSEKLDDICLTNVGGTYKPKSKPKSGKHRTDVPSVVQEYKDDELFHYKPGRGFPSFKNFSHHPRIASPEKLKARLEKYNAWLDGERSIRGKDVNKNVA